MVEVVEMQDYAFVGRWRFNPKQQDDRDQSSDDNEIPMDEYLDTIQDEE